MASRRKKNKPPVHHAAFAGRTVIEDEVANYVESEILVDGQAHPSSLPHLTHATESRKAHVTSSRVVTGLRASQVVAVSGAPTANFVIHQRFHQDDDGQSVPTHDRYFAVNQTTGVVSKATGTLDKSGSVHLGKKDEKPMRGDSLEKTGKVHPKMIFEIREEDSKVPPLSPRTVRRTLPDTGHAP